MAARLPARMLGPLLPAMVFCSMASPLEARDLPDPTSVVESWVRPAGDSAALESPSLVRVKLDLDTLQYTEVTRFDPQYGKRLTFRGVPLGAVIERLHPPASADLALLHFANGMAVPLPFRDARVMDRLTPFIARKIRTTRDAPASTEFPPLTRPAGEFADVRATSFVGNKVVVAELWHPAVSDKGQATFSPWSQVDSLVAIELVQSAAYYAQFEVDRSPPVAAGLELFRGSCQFCHGARKVGAKFGWDFVEPVPMYTYRKGERHLYYHVRYRRFDAAARGQNMPALKFMTEADAGNLWQWLKTIGTRPMRPYNPMP